MLYYIFYPFKELSTLFNLLEYITFRAGASAILALLISFILGPWIIRLLNENQIGEEIRLNGPKTHLKKKGTPTMGGIIIIFSLIIPTLLFARLDNPFIKIIIFSTLWMGFVGFMDDYLKVIKKVKSGLSPKVKILAQILLGCIVSIYIFKTNSIVDFSTKTSIPFFKNIILNLGSFYPLMIILVITGTSNVVNLTDGLDGLAAGLLAICFSVFAIISYISGRIDFSDYLNIIYLPGAGELAVFSAAMAGACIGYLWFNTAPAEIFMGDTGSLSTGAALGTISILLKKELLLIIIGGVFVWEAISVIIQLTYFKYTKLRYGKGIRFFKMAPIHHHFELSNWPESKIVVRFWIIGLLLALFSLTTFKVR